MIQIWFYTYDNKPSEIMVRNSVMCNSSVVIAFSLRVSHLTRILNIEYRDNLHSRQLGLVIMKVGQLTLPLTKNF